VTAVIIVFVAALSFALIGTPVARSLAFRLGLIATPRADRAHTEPTAMMGGVAIYVGATVALLTAGLAAQRILQGRWNLSELAGILAGATVMGVVGLWDDRVRLRPLTKLVPQFIAAALPMLAGVYIDLPLPLPLNILLTVCWILYVTNAVNFCDNLDGVAAGISTVAAGFFTLIAAMNGQHLVSALAAAVMGACLGFLRYNLPVPRATIFMGDAGALFLGYILAILGIKLRFPDNVRHVTWMVPILVLGVPLFDATMVFLSRYRRGVRLMQGGVDHSSHRLVRLGFGKLGAGLALDLVGVGLGMTAVFIMQANIAEGYAVGLMVAAIAVYALWKLEWQLSQEMRVGKVPGKAHRGGVEDQPDPSLPGNVK